MELLEFANDCTEQHLFCCIYSLGGVLWQMNHDLADGRLESTSEIDDWLINAQNTLADLVSKTNRFDVKKPLNENKSATQEYWTWYYKMKKWWDDLTPAKRDDIITRINSLTR